MPVMPTGGAAPTAGEILGAFQLGLITQEEAREALGFPAKASTIEVVK